MTRFATCVAIALLLAGCEKARFDEEVRRLCAKDGGIKVYETVKLRAEQFGKFGELKFYRPTQGENALGAEYIYKFEIQQLRQGNPRLSRYHIQVIRRSDRKMLGESISYGRGGGDLPGPWHESSFSCPAPSEAGEINLFKRVFVKSTEK